ncbi:GAF domain-containing protein [Myxacorys almedinensis]|uniref:histidine kinase n=1 Tax=Myxacorys almedinensis A TaxID=2690445 RepID=A0A8J7Z7F3_9CYAN|nr:GAF domain-containing protein [Myxacorys almedinensis]NDJ19418.1 GAF domain-containing protein [Myxacorys almedinensis A]
MTEALPKPTPLTALLPPNEAERLKALRRYQILDTPPETAFDRITALAARLFNMPITLVSLIDESRGWFKSSHGFDPCEVQRDATICSFAVLSDDVLVIPDTRQDDRLTCNPFVQSEPGLRFYAGAPLLTQDGYNLGTLCLLDTKPHPPLTDDQKATLADLAAMVVDELELRLAARKAAQIDAALLEVTQGVATVTGDAFFTALVQHFAKVLGADYIYIGLVDEHNVEMLHTIAVCAHGQSIDNFAYSLHDTPCREVIRQRKLCCYPSGVQAHFPHAPLLEPLNVESYIAVPFYHSNGAPLGLLGVMHSEPLENVQLAETLLPIFALRIGTELEHQQVEVTRRQVQSELEHLVEQRTAELSSTNELLHLEIAERQQAKAALQREQELLKALLDNVQAGIVACDADGVLTLFNRAAREFHGLPEQPLPPEQWAEYYDLYLADGKTRMTKSEIPLFQALQGLPVDGVEMMIIPKQGTARTLLASGQAIRTTRNSEGISDAHGLLQGAVVVMHDITERKAAEAELRISDVALQQMPDAILLTDLEGKIQRWLGNAEQIFGYTAAEAIGKSVQFLHHPDNPPTIVSEMMRSLQETGAFSGEIPCQRCDGSEVPIETTAKTVYDKAGHPLFFVGINKDITDRKRAEAERAQLIREQTARLEAEADQQRSAFLVEITLALASSLEYERTLTSVAELVVPFFADWCAVDLLHDNHTIHRVVVAHRDPEKVNLGWELHRQYPRQIDEAEGIAKVLRTGQTELGADISDAMLASIAHDASHLHILRELGLTSYIISPLIARGQILGAMTFVMAESHRHYSAAEVALAEDITHRAAIAIDNARLYQEAQQAQQAAEQSAARVTRLQSVTAALSESLTPAQVSDVIVDQGIAALGATVAMVALLHPTGTELEVVRAIGFELDQLAGWDRFSLDAPLPLAEAVRTGQPIWAEPSAARAVRYPHLAQQYAEQPLGAWISIPLMVEGRAVGGMSFGFAEPQHLDGKNQAFILSLAQQCAQAIARTHLYEAEQTARALAESANRVKDEFLAVLSHELRTPLNPILGWSKLLRAGKLDGAKTAQALDTIERNAKMQAQLIEDLLDISRILQGKLRLNAVAVDLAETIQAAIETVRLSAIAKSITIQFEEITEASTAPLQVSGDAGRLQQVIWNLLTNAIKFTQPGGQVDIKLTSNLASNLGDQPGEEILTQYAQITVSDTGKGIDPAFLPHVFDYFRQADSTTTRKFGGLGLGLAIVRHLVELHGGTVRADSPGEGMGATLTVWLPTLKPNDRRIQEDRLSSQCLPPASLLTSLRVLVVDDEIDSCELVAFILGQSGAIVTSASSAAEALQAVEQARFDVLVSDIGMPEMNGYALIQQIRMLPQGKQLVAVALTAYAGDHDRQHAIAAGFQHHIPKPIEPETLTRAIADLVKQQRSL